jgi:hypothetical protein
MKGSIGNVVEVVIDKASGEAAYLFLLSYSIDMLIDKLALQWFDLLEPIISDGDRPTYRYCNFGWPPQAFCSTSGNLCAVMPVLQISDLNDLIDLAMS